MKTLGNICCFFILYAVLEIKKRKKFSLLSVFFFFRLDVGMCTGGLYQSNGLYSLITRQLITKLSMCAELQPVKEHWIR